MTRKRLVLLLLFLGLYEAAAWVGEGLVFSASAYRAIAVKVPLFVAASAGALALLVKLIAAGPAWKSRRKPAAAPPAQDEALDASAALLRAADEKLHSSPLLARGGAPAQIADFPFYLVLGDRTSGKSSLVAQSGIEAELLSEQDSREAALAPAAFNKVWFARGTLFVECSAQVLEYDSGRLARLMALLQGGPHGNWVREMWGPRPQGPGPRGVIFCLEASHFLSTPAPDRQAALSRGAQDHLRALAKIFGASFPVYVVLTKADLVHYFSDFFARLAGRDDEQVLGHTMSFLPQLSDAGEGGRAQVKRIGEAFSALYYSLAGRRLEYLARETARSKKPAIYEFPREFKKLRDPLVQFLADTFRPDPLNPSPLLRGFYFTGVRRVVGQPVAMETIRTTVQIGGATQLFHFGADPLSTASESGDQPVPRGGIVSRWAFVHDLFERVILAEPVQVRSRRGDPARERRAVAALVVASLLLLALLLPWSRSWQGNRELIGDVEQAAARLRGAEPSGLPSHESLEALDGARMVLLRYDPDEAPWRLRWGLYAGRPLLPALRDLYFARFRTAFLGEAAGDLAAQLAAAPPAPTPTAPYWPVYNRLKAYRMITSRGCAVDPAFLSPALMDNWGADRLDADRQALLRKQVAYYAQELKRRNPYSLAEDADVLGRGRLYLSKVGVLERAYRGVIEDANRSVAKPARLADLAPTYRSVLSGNADVAPAFTRDGWVYVQQKIRSGQWPSFGEACVLGNAAPAGASAGGAAAGTELQKMYIRDYVRTWTAFLSGMSVNAVRSPEEAAARLRAVTDFRSPLLALVYLVARETNVTFVQPTLEEPKKAVQEELKKYIPGLAEKARRLERERRAQAPPDQLAPDYVVKIFQPVHAVVPPSSQDKWIGPSNEAYIKGLTDLEAALEKIAAERGGKVDLSVHDEARKAAESARAAVRKIAQTFNVTSPQGVDTALTRLLEAPIDAGLRYVITDPAQPINAALRGLCGQMAGLIRKYPFDPRSDRDVSAAELSAVFAPGDGSLWKFQKEHLANLLAQQEGAWQATGQEPKPGPQFLAFFARVASISSALFASGRPGMTYTLFPLPNLRAKSLVMNLDGEPATFELHNPQAHRFKWPGEGVAQVKVAAGDTEVPFVSRTGLWAVFRMLEDTEPRAPGGKMLEFSRVRSGGSTPAPVIVGGQPVRVQIQIQEFPGGVDAAFDRGFFTNLGCPARVTD